MSSLHHRAPGLPGAALTYRPLVPSLIPDGVHVHPAIVKLALGVRPDAVLVTDAVATAPPAVERGGAAYLPDGTLAGSVLTMLEGVQRVVAFGVPVSAAIRHATGNPAAAIGASARGRLAPGARADVVALDPETLALRAVWSGGEVQAQSGGPDRRPASTRDGGPELAAE
jgi:N-acetylglucosamine-6-phosphate deacetylase